MGIKWWPSFPEFKATYHKIRDITGWEEGKDPEDQYKAIENIKKSSPVQKKQLAGFITELRNRVSGLMHDPSKLTDRELLEINAACLMCNHLAPVAGLPR